MTWFMGHYIVSIRQKHTEINLFSRYHMVSNKSNHKITVSDRKNIMNSV
jgi:hypothetical protein